MVGSSLLRALLQRRIAAARPAPAVPAASRAPAEAETRARRAHLALSMGIARMPQRPGLWLRTTRDGRQRVYRVTDQNGELYALVGTLLPVAIPTARMPGHWDPIERTGPIARRTGAGGID